MKAEKKGLSVPRQIWALGFVSLFMDVSSEMVHGLLPVFLVSVLGASVLAVGLLEGLAEGTTLVLKVFSGPLSDWWGRRKPLVLAGYSMAALSKPFFALANSVGVVYAARLFDRVGKGVREAPRDALIADLTHSSLRGEAFGLRQSLDTVGAVAGPLLAIALMWLSSNDYRLVFWIAALPASLAVLILFFGLEEPAARGSAAEKAGSRGRAPRWADVKEFSGAFWLVAGAGAIFQLARFSEAFLILRARDFGLPLELAPAVLIVMNVVYAAAAYPMGKLSDQGRRENFLLAGLLVLCLSDIALAFGDGLWAAFLGVALWGFHLGLTQSALAALVADHCPERLRGTAYGLFNLLSALALLIASTAAGLLWENFGGKATFVAGAGFALLSFFVYLAATRAKWMKPRAL